MCVMFHFIAIHSMYEQLAVIWWENVNIEYNIPDGKTLLSPFFLFFFGSKHEFSIRVYGKTFEVEILLVKVKHSDQAEAKNNGLTIIPRKIPKHSTVQSCNSSQHRFYTLDVYFTAACIAWRRHQKWLFAIFMRLQLLSHRNVVVHYKCI